MEQARRPWHPNPGTVCLALALGLAGCELLDTDEDGYPGSEDCDDYDARVHPDAEERCDEVDNDCDDRIDEWDAVDIAIWYRDADGDGYGDANETTEACTLPGGYEAEAGDCDDNDASRHPEATEMCDDGVDNDCSGGDERTGERCAHALAVADIAFLGERLWNLAGDHVSGAGDVDGDGLDDLLIGALGTTYLLFGRTLISAATPFTLADADLKIVDEAGGDLPGDEVSAAGDVDNDGLNDVLIGATGEDSGGEQAGAVHLLLGGGALGSASGRLALSEADARLLGPKEGDRVGESASGVDDVDGDGQDDLLIGAYGDDTGGTDAGAAWLLFNDALSMASTPPSLPESALQLVGEEEEDQAGSAVSGTGDVDGDGLADVLVGASGAEAVYLLLAGGGTEPMAGPLDLVDADLKLVGSPVGGAVSGAGDVNGDGLDDLLLGAASDDSGGHDAGAAWLIRGDVGLFAAGGTRDLPEIALQLVGERANGNAGHAVASAGDVDGDGLADVMVGAPGLESDHNTSYLLLGGDALSAASATLNLAEASLTLIGDEGGWAGFSLSGAGDVNGDGRDDLLIGEPLADEVGEYGGAAYLFFAGAW